MAGAQPAPPADGVRRLTVQTDAQPAPRVHHRDASAGRRRHYVVTVRAMARNGTEWLTLDRFDITSVTWSDGQVEGDPKPAADIRVVDTGTARQLTQIVLIARAAAQAPEAHPLAKLRDDIAALSITVPAEGPAVAQWLARIGMQNAKNAALNDIAEVSSKAPLSPDAHAVWLTSAAAKYNDWLTRIRAL